MTEMPDQPCVSIAVSSGKIAASVLPPAVGASSKTSAPSSTGPAASSCSARSDRQPSVLTMWCTTTGCSRLTMWCTTTGCSRSSAELTAVPHRRLPRAARRSGRQEERRYQLRLTAGSDLGVSQHHRQTLRKAIHGYRHHELVG